MHMHALQCQLHAKCGVIDQRTSKSNRNKTGNADQSMRKQRANWNVGMWTCVFVVDVCCCMWLFVLYACNSVTFPNDVFMGSCGLSSTGVMSVSCVIGVVVGVGMDVDVVVVGLVEEIFVATSWSNWNATRA